ncbi:hypothetical protein OC846_002891 [Tilletia horrida]|uniref:Uncharacterized protein n=1 Tax=Tilletia horrida TaxID=155126 RepID=A0AAN6GR75_9BASI|nr:hypothetical protein OC845_002085 [Tilletia horrida]KAK0552487.1 hypothetical protein OC846_002891 [Tilletia horrida]
MPFEDAALHAILLSGVLDGHDAGGNPDVPSYLTSDFNRKQRVANLYAQSIAKRSEWASSLNTRTFSAGPPSNSVLDPNRRVSGPKAPRSWSSQASGLDLAGRGGSGGVGPSISGRPLETVMAAVIESEEEAGAGSTRGSTAAPRRAVEAYHAQFLRPSPTSLAFADLRLGNEGRLAAAAALQPEWRASTTSSLKQSDTKTGTVLGEKSGSKSRDQGQSESDVQPEDQHKKLELEMLAKMATRFRRLSSFGILEFFQQGSNARDVSLIRNGLNADILPSRITAHRSPPSLTDICLGLLIQAFQPLNELIQAQELPSGRRRRRRIAGPDLKVVLDDRSAPNDSVGLDEGTADDNFGSFEDSVASLPVHLRARCMALLGRLAGASSPHAGRIIQMLFYGSHPPDKPARHAGSGPAPDDWETAESEENVEVAEDSNERSSASHNSSSYITDLSTTELDLSFVPLRKHEISRLLNTFSIASGLGSSLRVLSLAGLNQPDLQHEGRISAESATTTQRISDNDVLRLVQQLPALEVLSLAGSCLSPPPVRKAAQVRGIPHCASCDQVFAASSGDMLIDVTLTHPQRSAQAFLSSLSRATPRLTVLDLSYTCWIDSDTLKAVHWGTSSSEPINGQQRGPNAQIRGEGSGQALAGNLSQPQIWPGTSVDTRRTSAPIEYVNPTGSSSPSSSRSGSRALVWLRLERLIVRGCPHLITSQPPGPIIPEYSTLSQATYTRARFLEQRQEITLADRNLQKTQLALLIRGQKTVKDPAVRSTDIIWEWE